VTGIRGRTVGGLIILVAFLVGLTFCYYVSIYQCNARVEEEGRLPIRDMLPSNAPKDRYQAMRRHVRLDESQSGSVPVLPRHSARIAGGR
jgi:hypothetical protein